MNSQPPVRLGERCNPSGRKVVPGCGIDSQLPPLVPVRGIAVRAGARAPDRVGARNGGAADCATRRGAGVIGFRGAPARGGAPDSLLLQNWSGGARCGGGCRAGRAAARPPR